jgi:hypothetical protein
MVLDDQPTYAAVSHENVRAVAENKDWYPMTPSEPNEFN